MTNHTLLQFTYTIVQKFGDGEIEKAALFDKKYTKTVILWGFII